MIDSCEALPLGELLIIEDIPASESRPGEVSPTAKAQVWMIQIITFFAGAL
jgi:hypothetical protein